MFRAVVFLILSIPFLVNAQMIKITGRVITSTGRAIPDAKISTQPPSDSTFSNPDGYFQLSVRKIPAMLHISHVAFLDSTITIPPTTGTEIDLPSVQLQSRYFMLPRSIVSANRAKRQSMNIIRSVNVIQPVELNQRTPGTTAELLREEEGLSVQKTNHGGGSLKIRGLSSSQILLAIDGIRLNNSIYRLGNHQYLTTIDAGLIGQLEVLRGPSSVLYGSDAMGGMVNIISSTPDAGFHGSSRSEYQTADGSFKNMNRLSVGHSRFYATGGFSYKQYGNLKRGAWNPYGHPQWNGNGVTQGPSGFVQRDWDAKIGWNISEGHSLLVAFQHTGQTNVPRYDKLELSHYRLWTYSPQIRDLAYAKYENILLMPFVDRVTASLSRQVQQEGRNYQKNPTDFITRERDKVITNGFSLQGEKTLSRHRLTAGTDLYFDDVSSKRRLEFTDSIIVESRGKYPDDAVYNSLGIYVQDEWFLNHKTLINGGLRYNYFRTDFDLQLNRIPQMQHIDTHFSDFTWQIGLRRTLSPEWSVTTGIYKGFRAPNLADMARFGESKGSTFEIPNTRLVPEKIVQTEIGLHKQGLHSAASLTIFSSWLSDLIDSADDSYNMSDSINVAGIFYKVKSKQNLGSGRIWGIESSFNVKWIPAWEFSGNFSYLRGQNLTKNEPLGGIPPAIGMVKITHRTPRWSVAVFSRFAAAQRRLSSDDRDDDRIPLNGTPGWWTLNSRFLHNLTSHATLIVALENIFDMNYREHGSGINNPGRNVVIGVHLKR